MRQGKAAAKPVKFDWHQRMAARVANIALPSRGYDIFGKLREKSYKKYGNFGKALDPRSVMLAPDKYMGTGIPKLPMTQLTDEAAKKNTFRTRTEQARQIFNMANLAPQINAQNQPARVGQASARIGMPAGNPVIEDSGWGVTLNQIMGSGMLSQEQLQAASYANVLSMVQMQGGNDNDRREMAFMLQRMILEGYTRGVDLVRDIKNDYGGTVKIQLTDGAVCSTTSTSIIGCGGMGYVQFRNGFWQNSADATKLALFYHEFGHEILNRGHYMVPTSLMGYDHFDTNWVKSASQYNSLVSELFSQANGVNRFTPTRGLDSNAVTNLIKQHPDWFPSVSGADPNGIGPNSLPNNTTNNNTTYNITPPTVNPGTPGGTITQSNMPEAGGGGGSEKTPVAGMLPDMAALQSFAAGLQDTLQRSAPQLQGLAGALQEFKSG